MIRKKLAPDLIRGGNRFSEKICSTNNWSADRFDFEAIALGNGGRAMSIALTLQNTWIRTSPTR